MNTSLKTRHAFNKFPSGEKPEKGKIRWLGTRDSNKSLKLIETADQFPKSLAN